MSNDLIRYDLLVQEALCGVVKKVLGDAARHGLPGDHHFYITFRTHAPGVRLSTRMREQYPEEMTIILQHQYEDLKVGEHGFEVGLSFKSIPEILLIPFEALTGFYDPSVPFNFKFEPQPNVDSEEAGEPGAPAPVVRKLPAPVAAPPALAAVPRIGAPEKIGTPEKTVPEKIGSPEKQGAPGKAPKQPDVAPTAAAAVAAEPAKVVSIDAFRKKP